jgi:protein-tyrosine kinase
MNGPVKMAKKHGERPPVSTPAPLHALVLSETSSPTSEAIRALRTHLMAQHLQAGRRGLAICAPHPEVGCTFLATNLAVALSQIGLHTLLVDGNMRDPGVDRLLPSSGDTGGLAACLANPHSNLGDYVEDNVYPNLSIMYAGGPVANAQELLATEWFEQIMNACLRDYDVTIVDTPPANSCADARRVSNVIGYSLIVTQRHKTALRDVKTFIEELRMDHAQVIGTVLNNG